MNKIQEKCLSLLWGILKAALAAGVIVWLLSRSGVSTADFARLAPAWIVLAALSLFVQNVMTAVRWRVLLRCVGVDLSFLQALSLTMQGIFFTLFIPAGAVSGDLVKAGLLAAKLDNSQRFNGIFSILADRICGFAGLLFSVLLVMACYLPVIRRFSDGIRLTMLICALSAVTGLVFIFALFYYRIFLKISIFRKIYDWLDRLTKGFCSRVAAVIDLYQDRRGTLLFWGLVSGLLLFPLYAVAFACIAAAAVPGGAWSASLLGGLLGEVAGVIPVTPGGIGTRDAIVAAVYSASGCSPEDAVVITTVFTAVLIAVSSIGAIFMIAGRIRKR